MDKLVGSMVEEMARAIYESIFADSFDDTRGIERAQYMQAGEACFAIAQKRVNELEADKAELERVCKVQVEVIAELEDELAALRQAQSTDVGGEG